MRGCYAPREFPLLQEFYQEVVDGTDMELLETL